MERTKNGRFRLLISDKPDRKRLFDHLGCGITQKVTLAAPPPLTLTTQVHPATSNTSASVKLLAAGGSPPLEYVLSGPGMDEIRQPDVDFTNLIPGSYLARVVDAQNCYTNNGFIIGEPLSLTASVTHASCGDNGSVTLVTSGGLPPFSFSIDHSQFQESPSFKNLGAGSYTVTAKDGQNAEATKIVTIAAPTEIVVVPSMFLPTMRVGATTDDKSVTADGFIHVQFDENSRKTSFKLKEGFDLRPTSSGLWELTVSSNDPDVKKYEGIYQAYFNACNHSLFIGFYKDGQYPNCVSDNHIGLRGERFCPEGWLPEDSYSDLVKNIMIFANGYRFYGKGAAGILLNSPKEYNETNNLITSDAINRYWSKESIAEEDQTDMDIEFLARRKPDVVYYADGHHSITTSNHNVANDVNRSMSEKFAPGIIGSMLAQANMAVSTMEEQFIYILSAMAADGYTVFEADKPVILKSIEEFRKKHKDILNCSGNPACVVLDTEPNDAGFKTRWENGKLAASDLLVRMASTKRPPNAKVIYNIDIVAHSMGFAYAQGMIEALKSHNNITWGSYYIIAPENGCSATYGKVDPAQWKDQIWQYGSNLGQGDPDPLWNQDGVAPQCPVTGLTDQSRAFIPATYGNGKTIPKGYLESHSISNYGWIFELNTNANGYVKTR
ncbi:SprB repeat-containing protein [Dyadobacter sp. 32]|uniref:SprB repeat-containing protein n=1 Tax=Dyadobacter sp. 32 TaxID=538966 RepID=UPI0011EE6564